MKKMIFTIGILASVLIVHSQPILYGTTQGLGGSPVSTISKYTSATTTLIAAHTLQKDGAGPNYGLLKAINGKLYGVTEGGGNNEYGIIFSFDPLTFTYKKLHDFDGVNGRNARATLIQASNGKLYGTTAYGGSYNSGTIFSFDPSTSTFLKVHDFDHTNGSHPFYNNSLVQADDGKLYGMTSEGGPFYGVIYSFDPSTSVFSKLYTFDYTNGSYPVGSLIPQSDGKFYGRTNGGGNNAAGVIFSFDPATNITTKLYDFNNNTGGPPNGGLTQGNDGKLYGMTTLAGIYNAGIIFSFDPVSSTYVKVHDFNIIHGGYPNGNTLLKGIDGKLYGMNSGGGSNNKGVIFSYNPSTSNFSKIYDFADGAPGANNLMQAPDGKLYGLNGSGGNTSGAIFSFDLITNSYLKLKDFNGDEGNNVWGSLMKASNDMLYGMSGNGGISNNGVIFSYNPSTSIYTKLVEFAVRGTGFTPINGQNAYGKLIQGNNGKLYGMTYQGGNFQSGVIFSLDPSNALYTKLYDLNRNNGGGITLGSLLLASNGSLYGMTLYGGTNDKGVIFSFNPSTSVYTKLIDFSGSNGRNPYGNSLMQARNGKLYGMTQSGGSSNLGVIFSYDPFNSVHTKLYDFDGTSGRSPGGDLMQAGDGKLYGLTVGGGIHDMGVIFSLDPTTSVYTKLYDFDSHTGKYPFGGCLMPGSDGKLYGVTNGGGASNYGVLFSFDPVTHVYTKLSDFDGSNGAYPLLSTLVEIGVAPTIETISLKTGYCEGASFKVHFITKGSFNSGNVFTAQLSDASGSFASPTNVGSVAGITNGNINVIIPANTVLGSGYRIRVIASNPAIVGSDNGSDFSISSNFTASIPDAKALPNGVLVNTVYLGYSPASSITIIADSSISNGNYLYMWSNGSTSQAITVSPTVTTGYSVTITNESGCFATTSKIINVVDVSCSNGKVYMCHITGNSNHVNTICIDNSAVASHLGAGCSLGECTGSRNAPSAVETEVSDFKIDIIPNPSSNYFNLVMNTSDASPVSVRIMDVLGRVVEMKNNMAVSEKYTFGNGLKPGVYLAEIIQNKNRKVIRLIKK